MYYTNESIYDMEGKLITEMGVEGLREYLTITRTVTQTVVEDY
jgi:hypothetical protein